jgi:hypothetical protein
MNSIETTENPWVALRALLAELVPAGPLRDLLYVLCAFIFPGGFVLVWRYYIGLLAQGGKPEGQEERRDYDDLRQSLVAGNWAAQQYVKFLSTFLDWLERSLGDDGIEHRSLFPGILGLKRPVASWTAPAFDRCMLFAFLYPLITIVFIWVIVGHVGLAEASLGLRGDLPTWQRGIGAAAYAASFVAMWRSVVTTGWRSALWWGLGALGPFIGLAALEFRNGPGSLMLSGFTYSGLTIAAYSSSAPSKPSRVEAFLGKVGPGVLCIIGAWAAPLLIVASKAGTGPLAFASAFVVALLVLQWLASKREWQGLFLGFFVLAMIVTCFLAARWVNSPTSWEMNGPYLLFAVLLAVINAPFCWFSIGLTRALLRRGLELQAWWPYLLAVFDGLLAAFILVPVLAVTLVISIQTFDESAVRGGARPVLRIDEFLDHIAGNPAALENWWAYILLLSAMIPSLVNLMIGGAALTRGLPWLGRRLLRWIPEGRDVPEYKREIAAGILTFQLFFGAVLGALALRGLVWLAIYFIPAKGLWLLHLTRWVVGLDLPAWAHSL